MVNFLKYAFGMFVTACAVTVAHAQQMPEELKGKTVTVVVPWGPGGNVDTVTRTLVQKIEQQQPDLKMIVANRPGAGGSVGGRFVADSEPNGLTIGQFTPSDMALNPLRNVPGAVGYGEITCFHYTIKWGSAILVSGDAPFNNLAQMVEFLKKDAKPSYATIGLITTLLAEQVLEETGTKNVIGVNYKSAPEAIRAVLGKETTFTVAPISEAVPLINDGKLKAIVVGTAERNKALPNVPSITETFKHVTMENALGFCVPRATPQKYIDYFNAVFDKAAKTPEFVDFVAKRGQIFVGGNVAVARDWYENSWKDWRQRNSKFGHLVKTP